MDKKDVILIFDLRVLKRKTNGFLDDYLNTVNR